LYCIWGDWFSRDQIAYKEKTFINCRFLKGARIYCAYKQKACAALGIALDYD
jgi:hypothetical protein